MEDLNEILSLLEVPTILLKSDIIQKVLIRIKKNNVQSIHSGDCIELHNKILQSLWTHLQYKLNEFDGQLLCSTCFYTVLSVVPDQDYFLHLILKNVNEELNKSNNQYEDNSTIMKTISYIYGMFQSSFLTLKGNEYDTVLREILNSALNLLVKMAYEYSHYTFIVFKILASLKKVLGTSLQDAVFAKHNQLRLLNLVNHNWENPINGIRNLNKSIFQIMVTVVDNVVYEQIIEEINSFYWNKAKYLMFSEIIDHHNGNFEIFLKRYNLVDGLMHSLHRPGLVSAGADMYYSVLKKINTLEEWSELFLSSIMQILNCSSQKATENFNNYWCLTTLKKFPLLGTLIINELQKCQNSEQNLFSILCLLKQSNKLNLIEKHWNRMTYIEQLVVSNTEHCNPHIRMSAYDIVCVSHGKLWPGEVEYGIILNFLSNNVNSDCTVLRLSILNSLNIFLGHIQTLYLNHTNSMKCDVDNLLSFCVKLQHFIITSLNLNGNYQRKISTIKIIVTIINCFSEIPKKRQKQMKQTNYTLINFLTDNKHWILFGEKVIEKLINLLSDPADDVRENVLQLLLNHYNKQLKQPAVMNQIIDNALLKIKSKFFYEINCGRSMFKLVINVLIKENYLEGVKLGNVKEIFHFAFTELMTEYKLKRDILESIEKGKQLHSNMCILSVIFETCLKVSHKLQIEEDTILSLLEILEYTSNQFVWEQGISTSSDFSKMSDMVQQIIEKSKINYATSNEDEAKITGLQQIVLNCLWLNVKASCELSALVIQYHNCDIHLDICEKSLCVITKVLETSRHKGAIEAAGVTLGEGIQILTSLPAENQLSKLPLSLLKQKLKELISEANNMASVTRRGAGLSIMIHRIVSNDMQKNKPLFYYFINTLLDTCKTLEESIHLKNISNVSNEKDLPKAIYIHFLTRIVTDSSLTTEVMYYSGKLAELAFDNLTSSHWQIRNAALQLYGALVPKLMGQKKASGSVDEVTGTVACDEFRTHFPQLWMFILEQLKDNNNKDKLQRHSILLPILNILGNIAKRYNFINDLNNQFDADNDLLKSLTLLLGSPIFTVRRLTAKCIFNMYSFDNIFEVLFNVEQTAENFLHGCLLLLVICNNHYKNIHKNKFDVLKNKFSAILHRSAHSYLCRDLLENINLKGSYNVSDVQEIILEMKNYSNKPGKFQWADTHIQKVLLNCSWGIMPHCLQLILNCSEYEKYCEILYSRIDTQQDVDELVLIEITNILLAFPKKMYSSVVWKILYKISLFINCNNLEIKDIMVYLNDKTISYKLRYIIPFVARITADEESLLILSKIIYKLCNAEMSDVDMRIIAAMANNEIASKINKLPDKIKVISIMSAIIQLQDEDENVRNLSVFFYTNATKITTMSQIHPYICLLKILNGTFLITALSNPSSGIKTISKRIFSSLSSITPANLDGYNPFASESKNIYQEVEVVKQLLCKLEEVDF